MVYAQGAKVSQDGLLLIGRRNDLGYSRLGLSVSRKHGPAVTRNLIKRRLREAFRLSYPKLPIGYDLVIVPQKEFKCQLESFQRILLALARRLEKKVESKRSGEQPLPREQA